jgi:hypothetical protein
MPPGVPRDATGSTVGFKKIGMSWLGAESPSLTGMEALDGGNASGMDERERAPFDEEGEPSEGQPASHADRAEPSEAGPGDSGAATSEPDEDLEALQKPGET